MDSKIRLISRPAEGEAPRRFTVSGAREARRFHMTLPGYAPTPLRNLRGLAEYLGVSEIRVKDESSRFGLNAFKVLGGSYCVHKCMEQAADRDGADGEVVFVTATDGNHGRGIAWAARQMHRRCVVYLPAGSTRERLENIRKLGAEASITEWNYDDTVRFAQRQAEENGWTLVQDTSWDGYEQIPTWIMQGYTTMGAEMLDQLETRPTHIFLQAGVGAMAGAMCGFFRDWYAQGEGTPERPIVTIVEPDRADCNFRTAEADDGTLHAVKGSLHTMMAGLACGEPCHVGFEQIRATADFYASVPDSVSARGMRVLGNPLGSDARVVSGESGAVTAGFVFEVLHNPELSEMKDALGLNSDSRILCISTEGDTDRENYRRVVWGE